MIFAKNFSEFKFKENISGNHHLGIAQQLRKNLVLRNCTIIHR